MEFTLISEGFQHNKTCMMDAVILRVRLNAIINSKTGTFFTNEYMPINEFVESLIDNDGKKAQIININLEDVDDIYAKVIVKIFSKMLFDFSKASKKEHLCHFIYFWKKLTDIFKKIMIHSY